MEASASHDHEFRNEAPSPTRPNQPIVQLTAEKVALLRHAIVYTYVVLQRLCTAKIARYSSTSTGITKHMRFRHSPGPLILILS